MNFIKWLFIEHKAEWITIAVIIGYTGLAVFLCVRFQPWGSLVLLPLFLFLFFFIAIGTWASYLIAKAKRDHPSEWAAYQAAKAKTK